jgi:hypothetical protein
MSYELKELKEDYGKLAEKHQLPSFEKMNEFFDIERIERESDVLLRTVRRAMMEKTISIVNFIEMLINPMQVPRMYHSFLKSMNSDDKKLLDKIYTELSKLIISSLECDMIYDERREVDEINQLYDVWASTSKDLKKIIGKIKKPDNPEKKERVYFG